MPFIHDDLLLQTATARRLYHAFPAAEPTDLPLSDTALQYFRSGVPWLQRNLPFWLASIASQLLVLLIPIIGVI